MMMVKIFLYDMLRNSLFFSVRFNSFFCCPLISLGRFYFFSFSFMGLFLFWVTVYSYGVTSVLVVAVFFDVCCLSVIVVTQTVLYVLYVVLYQLTGYVGVFVCCLYGVVEAVLSCYCSLVLFPFFKCSSGCQSGVFYVFVLFCGCSLFYVQCVVFCSYDVVHGCPLWVVVFVFGYCYVACFCDVVYQFVCHIVFFVFLVVLGYCDVVCSAVFVFVLKRCVGWLCFSGGVIPFGWCTFCVGVCVFCHCFCFSFVFLFCVLL